MLFLTEQGRGDMLQCIRYAPLLAERGATVLVQAYPDLVPLLAAMPAETLAPLLALPGFEFHCLQKEIAESDRIWLNPARPPFNLHVHRLDDFADTAALAVQINVIVTIDTAVAHLGGALGLPVHLMLPFNPDRRWMLARPDSR
ncbi:hypothetical protein [Acidisphaera sp. S103]|uniref:hypothetical protein n=1 Tax=Acidisphaera sp. S103 TaxID=1747223 RepID=UPI00131AF1F5|nr:hypothetical protein [Acidisphaera sp. S103]